MSASSTPTHLAALAAVPKSRGLADNRYHSLVPSISVSGQRHTTVDNRASAPYCVTLPHAGLASQPGRQAMERFRFTTGFSGRSLGRGLVCPRVRDIAPGGNGRSLPVGWET